MDFKWDNHGRRYRKREREKAPTPTENMLSPSVKEYLFLPCEAFQSPDNISFFWQKSGLNPVVNAADKQASYRGCLCRYSGCGPDREDEYRGKIIIPSCLLSQLGSFPFLFFHVSRHWLSSQGHEAACMYCRAGKVQVN